MFLFFKKNWATPSHRLLSCVAVTHEHLGRNKPRTRNGPWRPYLLTFRNRSLHSPPRFSQMGCFKTKLSSHFTAEETGFQRTQGASRVTGARHSPEPAVFPPPPVPWSRSIHHQPDKREGDSSSQGKTKGGVIKKKQQLGRQR